jgi:hypothetical protein
MVRAVPQTTVECAHEAVILTAYCEARFPVGPSTFERLSVTGETYTELCIPFSPGWPSAEAARIAAQEHFNSYAEGRKGTLYWRVPPEIAVAKGHAYYMRLLISDKPQLQKAS